MPQSSQLIISTTDADVPDGAALLASRPSTRSWAPTSQATCSPGVRDVVGGRTRSYEQMLERAQNAAMQMLHQRCRARGATHATGLRMDCEGLGPRNALIAVIITATLYRAR